MTGRIFPQGPECPRRRVGIGSGRPSTRAPDVQWRCEREVDGPKVFAELVRIALNSKNEQTRVAPIKEILDRAYGKSPQPLSGDNECEPVIVRVITGVPRATA